MSKTAMERRLDERRGPVRRTTDIQRALLEESLKELPRYFVSYCDPRAGVYSFYYNNLYDAQLMVAELKRQGIAEEAIALYARHDE
ncbi:MAG: hypothetical protein IT464_11945 [Planctomycetes bacterium]|nr:hypothetical protein [Planctomycetota bacterium]MCC7510064.1 hypothetical protein [Planctomycetota bacterium]